MCHPYKSLCHLMLVRKKPTTAAWGRFISLCMAVSSGMMPFYCLVQDSLCPGTSSVFFTLLGMPPSLPGMAWTFDRNIM